MVDEFCELGFVVEKVDELPLPLAGAVMAPDVAVPGAVGWLDISELFVLLPCDGLVGEDCTLAPALGAEDGTEDGLLIDELAEFGASAVLAEPDVYIEEPAPVGPEVGGVVVV